jgi:hypothetical protein
MPADMLLLRMRTCTASKQLSIQMRRMMSASRASLCCAHVMCMGGREILRTLLVLLWRRRASLRTTLLACPGVLLSVDATHAHTKHACFQHFLAKPRLDLRPHIRSHRYSSSHPAVVTFFGADFFPDRSSIIIATEFMDFYSVKDVLAQCGELGTLFVCAPMPALPSYPTCRS